MTQDARSLLIDGWLSPGMGKTLLITAEINSDDILEYGREFQARQVMPLSGGCDFLGICCIEYIPTDVLKRNTSGLYRSFIDGWGAIFGVCARILGLGLSPTVQRIRDALSLGISGSHFDKRYYQYFVEKGGRIEFALDAILNIIENVLKNGDDGWE